MAALINYHDVRRTYIHDVPEYASTCSQHPLHFHNAKYVLQRLISKWSRTSDLAIYAYPKKSR
jgi:hypothetical protein